MVDAGGVFEMQGGILEKNTCGRRNAGQKNSGCGGAVVNKGKFVLTRGTVKNNRAFGVQSERRGIGGAGGGIYNEGHCYIQSGDTLNSCKIIVVTTSTRSATYTPNRALCARISALVF